MRVPVPARAHRALPVERQLEQAARDAADRLISRFQVTPPPDNE